MKSFITIAVLVVGMFAAASDAEACRKHRRKASQQTTTTTVVRQSVAISATTTAQCQGATCGTPQVRFGLFRSR